MNSQADLEAIQQAIIAGDEETSVQAVLDALEAGVDAFKILNQGLMPGTNIVGQRFETGEYFLVELMMTGRALKAAMAVIDPKLKEQYASGEAEQGDTGVVVIATIQTDIHDIGKNIVSSMLSASGFEVHDLGVNVPIKTIIAKAQEVDANIIGLSALLTTTMPFMRDLIQMLDAMGERQRFKVMVGGASVTPEFAESIGADGTTSNAVKAVQMAQQFIRQQRQERAGG
jgi:corrinoid protein of di/trimethylamine methyltransferase